MTLEQEREYNALERFLNCTSKSGYVNIPRVIERMAKLVGLRPEDVVNKTRTI